MRVIRRIKGLSIEQPLPFLKKYLIRNLDTGQVTPLFGRDVCHLVRYLKAKELRKAADLFFTYVSIDEDSEAIKKLFKHVHTTKWYYKKSYGKRGKKAKTNVGLPKR